MRDLIRPILAACLAVFATESEGCKQASDPKTQADVTYFAAQMGCVEKASTVEESKVCRAKIDQCAAISETPEAFAVCSASVLAVPGKDAGSEQ